MKDCGARAGKGAAKVAASLLLLLLFSGKSYAQDAQMVQRCEARLPSQPVTVLTTPIAYTLDNSLPYREIAQLAGRERPGSFVLGLTRARFTTRIGFKATIMTDRDSSEECALPVFTVSLAYPAMVVYIGREFPEGSCGYREILMHELQHVQAFQQQLGDVEQNVRQAMAERFSRPFYAPRGESMKLLSREVSDTWKPFVLDAQRRVELLQAQIDKPEESRRVIRACGGEVRRILQQTRLDRPIPTGETP